MVFERLFSKRRKPASPPPETFSPEEGLARFYQEYAPVHEVLHESMEKNTQSHTKGVIDHLAKLPPEEFDKFLHEVFYDNGIHAVKIGSCKGDYSLVLLTDDHQVFYLTRDRYEWGLPADMYEMLQPHKDLGEHAGILGFAYPRIDIGKATPKQTAELICTLADKGYLFWDPKPENIGLLADGHAVICDRNAVIPLARCNEFVAENDDGRTGASSRSFVESFLLHLGDKHEVRNAINPNFSMYDAKNLGYDWGQVAGHQSPDFIASVHRKLKDILKPGPRLHADLGASQKAHLATHQIVIGETGHTFPAQYQREMERSQVVKRRHGDSSPTVYQKAIEGDGMGEAEWEMLVRATAKQPASGNGFCHDIDARRTRIKASAKSR